jgi:Lar family restriction alleviation protein
MSELLKPCPFCGGTNIESRVCDYGVKTGAKNRIGADIKTKPYIVGCRTCNISTSVFPAVARANGYRSAKEAAEAAWNRRAQSKEDNTNAR